MIAIAIGVKEKNYNNELIKIKKKIEVKNKRRKYCRLEKMIVKTAKAHNRLIKMLEKIHCLWYIFNRFPIKLYIIAFIKKKQTFKYTSYIGVKYININILTVSAQHFLICICIYSNFITTLVMTIHIYVCGCVCVCVHPVWLIQIDWYKSNCVDQINYTQIALSMHTDHLFFFMNL